MTDTITMTNTLIISNITNKIGTISIFNSDSITNNTGMNYSSSAIQNASMIHTTNSIRL